MGCVKETYDIIKDSLKGVSNRRKFKKLIDNMIFAIETKTVSEYFIYKFKILEKLASSITKKVLNDPIIFLKSKENRSSRNLYLDIARRLFNLDSNNNKKTK